MAYTGGPLNELNSKMGISAPYKSVAEMKLIKIHQPKSKEELVELIKFHFEHNCKCGIKSQGTVEDFGRNLYNAQKTYWRENRYTLKECIQWEYDLFVIQSLKGGVVEKKAVIELGNLLTAYKVSEAEGYLDEELRIDLIISNHQMEVCGVQVKPSTFLLMRRSVITFNIAANKKWDKPVYYLYYNENEIFENLHALVNIIKKND